MTSPSQPRTRAIAQPLCVAFALWALFACGRASAEQQRVRIPIVFALSVQNAELPAFLATQLEHANRIFGPLGIELSHGGQKRIADVHAHLTTRAERDALLGFARRGAITCVVVQKLMDVDEPGRERRGVHWRARDGSWQHLVIVSTISGPYVLAHELGHFFGLRAHSDTPGNLMSYESGTGPPFLDDAQRATVRRTLARMLRSGELLARTNLSADGTLDRH